MKTIALPNNRLTVELEKVIFFDADSGFTLADVVLGQQAFEMAGYFNGGVPGGIIKARGFWKHNCGPKPQFYAETFTKALPQTPKGVAQFLNAGVIEGLNQKLAKQMAVVFGSQTFDVLIRNDAKLGELNGLTPAKRLQITASWRGHLKIKEIAAFLCGISISPAFAASIYEQLGDTALEQIKNNPFILVSQIKGLSFMGALRIARRLNFHCDNSDFAQYGFMALLRKLASKGHVYYPYSKLLSCAVKKLGVTPDIMAEAVARCAAADSIKLKDLNTTDGYFVLNNKAVYLKENYLGEKNLAESLKRLNNSSFAAHMQPEAVCRNLRTLDINDKLKTALITILTSKCVLVDEPASNRERLLLKTLTRAGATMNLKITVAAMFLQPNDQHQYGHVPLQPLAELLGHDSGTGAYPECDIKLDCDVMVATQAALLDMHTLNRLIAALPNHAILVLSGNGMLPSLPGPGRVFADLTATGSIPIVKLDEMESEKDVLLDIAQKISLRRLPKMSQFTPFAGQNQSFFYFIEQDDITKIYKTVSDLCGKHLTKALGYDRREIMVASFARKGPLGSKKLNLYLQEKLNKHKKGFKYNGFIYKVKDKVIQTQPNAAKKLYAGQSGQIKSLNLHKKEITVQFADNFEVVYKLSEMDGIKPAYALPANKIYGGKYKAVIMPLHDEAHLNLNRNALYAALAAAENMLIVVGQKHALETALKTIKHEKRYTGLKELLLT